MVDQDRPAAGGVETAQPWSAHAEDLRGGTYWTIDIPGCEPIDLRADDNGQAIAQLIVAAVNERAVLLALLREFVDTAGNPSPDLLKRAAAALAQAEERQP